MSKAKVAELVAASLEALRACELRMEESYENVSASLRRIHDEALYKADKYATFDVYCEQRWGYSKTRAYQLVDHARLVEHMKKEGVEVLPSGEGHTRPLMKLRRTAKDDEAFLQKATMGWQMAVDSAPEQFDVPRITAQHVESTIQHQGLYRPAKKSNGSTIVPELRDVLTRLKRCDALKMSGYDFVKKHGSSAFPNEFLEIVNWLTECAEVAEIGGEG